MGKGFAMSEMEFVSGREDSSPVEEGEAAEAAEAEEQTDVGGTVETEKRETWGSTTSPSLSAAFASIIDPQGGLVAYYLPTSFSSQVTFGRSFYR